MADDVIKSLAVRISGDLSNLETALASIPSMVQQAGTALQSALTSASDAAAQSFVALGSGVDATATDLTALSGAISGNAQVTQNAVTVNEELLASLTGASGSAEEASKSIDAAAQSTTAMGSGAAEAAPQVEALASSNKQAGDSAAEAETGLKAMAEQLVALGEALVITEALKEFGTEALSVYATIQSVTVGLTQLTGSAETAEETIAQIKTMAETQPFAFPELAPTAQRLVAFGVTVGQLPGVLQAAADAASATGNSFDAVASSIGRVELTGQISARQLVQLGVSFQDLAKTAGVSMDEIQALVKKGGQSAAADMQLLLDTVEQKFGGAAAAQAQTLAGEWQILQNKFEEVMEAIGQALAPIITDLMNFATGAVAAAKAVAEAFEAVPEPLRDAAVAAALIVAALAPLAVALSGILLSIQALSGLLPAISALFGGLAVEAGAAAVAEGSLATANAALEASTESLVAGPLTELGAALEAAGIGSRDAANGLVLIGEGSTAAAPAASALATALGTIAVATGPVLLSLSATKTNIDMLKQSWDDMIAEIRGHSIADAVNAGATLKALESMGYSVDQIRAAFSSTGPGAATTFQQISSSIAGPYQALLDMGFSVKDIQTALQGVQADGVPAFVAIKNGATIPELTTLGFNIDQISQKLNGMKDAATTAWAGFTGGITVNLNALNLLGAGSLQVIAQQKALDDEVTRAKTVFDNLTNAYQNGKTTLDGTAVTLADVQRAQVQYDAAVTAATPHLKDQETGQKAVNSALDSADVAYQKFLDVMAGGNAKEAQSTLQALQTDIDKLGNLSLQTSGVMKDEIDISLGLLNQSLGQLHAAIEGDVNDWTQQMSVADKAAQANQSLSQVLGDGFIVIDQGGQTIVKYIGDLEDADTAAGVVENGVTMLRSAVVGLTADTGALADGWVYSNGVWEKSSALLADVADAISNVTAAADQATAAIDGMDAAASNPVSVGSKGSKQSGSNSAESVLGQYAAAGALGSTLDQLAQSMGLVRVGNNQYEDLATFNAELKAAGDNFHYVFANGNFTIVYDQATKAVTTSTAATTSQAAATAAQTTAVTASTGATTDGTVATNAQTVAANAAAVSSSSASTSLSGVAVAADGTQTTLANLTVGFNGVQTAFKDLPADVQSLVASMEAGIPAMLAQNQAASATAATFQGVASVSADTISSLTDMNTALQQSATQASMLAQAIAGEGHYTQGPNGSQYVPPTQQSLDYFGFSFAADAASNAALALQASLQTTSTSLQNMIVNFNGVNTAFKDLPTYAQNAITSAAAATAGVPSTSDVNYWGGYQQGLNGSTYVPPSAAMLAQFGGLMSTTAPTPASSFPGLVPSAPSMGSGLALTVNVTGNTLLNSGMVQDLSNTVAKQVVDTLRNVAGLKV